MSITRQPLFIFTFWLFFVIALLHHAAIYLYFYWTIPWFDMLMHFLGGAGIASAFLWLIYWSRFIGSPVFTKKRALLVAILASFIIGILWEYFELWGDIIVWPEDLTDSKSDLALDTIGGIAAFYNSLRYRKFLTYGK